MHGWLEKFCFSCSWYQNVLTYIQQLPQIMLHLMILGVGCILCYIHLYFGKSIYASLE
jgi:hypothetical protein